MAFETTLHRRNDKTHPRLRQAQVKLLHISEDWNRSRRVNYWEIIADNLSKAGWTVGLRLNCGFSRTNNLNEALTVAAMRVNDELRD